MLISIVQREKFFELMGKDVQSALASQVVLLDKIKNVSEFVKVVLDIGKDFAEVIIYHAYMCVYNKANLLQLNDAAKLVLGLADKLFKARSLFRQQRMCALYLVFL